MSAARSLGVGALVLETNSCETAPSFGTFSGRSLLPPKFGVNSSGSTCTGAYFFGYEFITGGDAAGVDPPLLSADVPALSMDDVDLMDDPSATIQQDHATPINDTGTLTRKQWRYRKKKLQKQRRKLSNVVDSFLQ